MTGFVTKKITNKKRTLGAILKSARTRAEVTLEQAEKETKICHKYLVALEDGNYSILPAEAYNIGFVRTYAQYLKLSPEKIIQMYREERAAIRVTFSPKTVTMAPRRMADWHFLLTPKLLGVIAAIVVFGGMATYVFMQLRAFSQPPTISMNVPTEYTSSKDTVLLDGTTAPGATVYINNEPILVNEDGSFSQDVQLSPGVNQFMVQAKSRAQKQSQVAVRVLYDQQGVASLPLPTTTE